MTDDNTPQPANETQTPEQIERAKALEKLPPPRFETLIQLLSSQAVLALGMIPGPDGKLTKELPLARDFSDLLSILDEKTKGNLSDDEAKQLEVTLHDLRMIFLQQSKS